MQHSKQELFKMYDRIYAETDKAHEKMENIPVLINSRIQQTPILVERYGMCFWKKIRFLKGNEEVYRLERGLDFETRIECFFSEKTREYSGNRCSATAL